MPTQNNKLDFSNQNVYVGFDVHKKNWRVTIMVNEFLHRTFVQDPRPALLRDYLYKNFPGANYHSAYEAGFCGFWIHDALKSYGINSIIVNPADIPTTGKELVQKEDSRDSRKIARSLSAGLLKGIYVPSQETLGERALVRLRSTFSSDLSRTKNRIKAFLHFNGIEIPAELQSGAVNWTKSFLNWLESLDLNSGKKQSLQFLLEQHHSLNTKKRDIMEKIKCLATTPKYKLNHNLLTSIPGIGLITAMQILTEIEDINRFERVDQFSSFIGFVPSTKSSGEKDRTGNITNRGHSSLRAALIESAWAAIGKDPVLSQKFHELKKRMDPNQAAVRIAKKLTARIYRVLKVKQEYELLKY
jgi:transposase